jgi:tetratricopeptide (TPR) repeat protein
MMGRFNSRAHRIFFASALLLFTSALLDGQAQQNSNAVLQGTVRNVKGAPVAGASVHLAKNDGSDFQQTTTDGKGSFTLAAPAGDYVLRVEKPGFDGARQTVTLALSDRHKCDLVLVPKIEGNTAANVEFSDKPDFAVAGVTDWTAAGGHGSDVNLRTSEALAKDTRALADGPPSVSAADLQRRRDQLKRELAANDRADLHRNLGDLDEQMNDSLAAVHEYERAAQLDPSESNYFAWGTELLIHRAVQPAVEVFGRGVNSYPHSERLLIGLGAALYASGLYAQAAERLCTASDVAPRDPTPYLFLGKMLQAASQPLPCAEEKLARFVRDQPRNASANYYYALALWKSAGPSPDPASSQRVASFLEKAVKLDPNFAAAHLQLGTVDSGHNLADAIAEYQRAIVADPGLAEAHFRLAQAYKKVGQAEKARDEFAAYQRIQATEASKVEQRRREIQQFVVVYKDRPRVSEMPKP